MPAGVRRGAAAPASAWGTSERLAPAGRARRTEGGTCRRHGRRVHDDEKCSARLERRSAWRKRTRYAKPDRLMPASSARRPHASPRRSLHRRRGRHPMHASIRRRHVRRSCSRTGGRWNDRSREEPSLARPLLRARSHSFSHAPATDATRGPTGEDESLTDRPYEASFDTRRHCEQDPHLFQRL